MKEAKYTLTSLRKQPKKFRKQELMGFFHQAAKTNQTKKLKFVQRKIKKGKKTT